MPKGTLWDDDEVDLLYRTHRRLGSNWEAVAKAMKTGRTPDGVSRKYRTLEEQRKESRSSSSSTMRKAAPTPKSSAIVPTGLATRSKSARATQRQSTAISPTSSRETSPEFDFNPEDSAPESDEEQADRKVTKRQKTKEEDPADTIARLKAEIVQVKADTATQVEEAKQKKEKEMLNKQIQDLLGVLKKR